MVLAVEHRREADGVVGLLSPLAVRPLRALQVGRSAQERGVVGLPAIAIKPITASQPSR